MRHKKRPKLFSLGLDILVGPLGLEPRLFCTKNRRVASYTMGQRFIADANLKQSLFYTNIFKSFFSTIFLSPYFQALKNFRI